MNNSKSLLIFFSLLFFIVISPNSVLAEEVDEKVCIGGKLYNITSKGSKVTDVWDITTEHLRNKSILPAKYFEMKDYIRKNNINLKAQNNGFGTQAYWKYQEFRRKYGTIYDRYGVNQPEADYAFTATFLSQKCTRVRDKDGRDNWESCPTAKMLADGYYSENFQNSISEFGFDEARKQFYLDVSDTFTVDGKSFSFNGNVMVRVVRNGVSNLEEYEFKSLAYTYECNRANCVRGSNDQLLSLSKGQTIRVYFDKNAEVNFEFYMSDNYRGDCQHAYVGYVRTTAPATFDVANPWLNSTICKNFRNNQDKNGNFVENYANMSDETKQILVSECYSPTVEYFRDIEGNGITETLLAKNIFDAAQVYNVQREGTNLSGGLQCHYHEDGTYDTAKTETIPFDYNPNNSKYWSASCYETATVRYDQPKKVISGAGFEYFATVEITRTCVPVAVKVKKPTQCRYAIECYGGPAHHSGESGAGPNEEFDSCISSCDGGKYTQDCINKCYSTVYEEDTSADGMASSSFMDVALSRMNNTSSTYVQPTFVFNLNCSQYSSKNTPNLCYEKNNSYSSYEKNKKKSGRGRYIANLAAANNQQSNCDGSTKCWSKHGIGFTYLNGCNSDSNPTLCYEVYNGGITKLTNPSCSDNPDVDIEIGKSQSRQEYQALLGELQSYTYYNEDPKADSFVMKITDTYEKENGQLKTYTFTGNAKDKENSMIKVEGGVSKYSDGKNYKVVNTKNVVYAEDGSTIETQTIEVKKTYTINLPRTYINQLTAEEMQVKVNEIRDYSTNYIYRDGGNKYYTDINTGTFNDYRNWTTGGNYYPANDFNRRIGNNIKVEFKNMGTLLKNDVYTWNSIPIDCFYGVLNQRYIECEDDICEILCDPDKDICTGGLQYYFRQVNLKDLFPQRNPRWNWTNYASVKEAGYTVVPSEVIDEIQDLGNDVFLEEPVYEINLTGENIRTIRSKNDDYSYQTMFDGVSCDLVNGMEVCESAIDNYVKSIVRNTELGTND